MSTANISSFGMFSIQMEKTSAAFLSLFTSNDLVLWTTLYKSFLHLHWRFPCHKYLIVNHINTRSSCGKWKSDQRRVVSWVFGKSWISKRSRTLFNSSYTWSCFLTLNSKSNLTSHDLRINAIQIIEWFCI